ncbi:MAG: hypothetical protein ABR941_04700 [Thermoleophilia bacterium]|jgi:hypothetical protein
MRRFLLVFALAVGVLALLAAPVWASAKTFYVHPSGGNDTNNIQKAFNAAVKAGPGSTVQLSAGHFYANNIVVTGFNGYFKGAGEGRTVIDTLRGLYPHGRGVTEKGNPGYYLLFFLFQGGDVRVSDLGFDITATSPAETWNDYGTPADFLGSMVGVLGNASSSFDRVSFTAGAGNDNGYNADEDLYISGIGPMDANQDPTTFWSTTGIDSVCNCSFGGNEGMQVNGLTAGRLTVSGNVASTLWPCYLVDDSARGSAIAISHNQMQAQNWYDVVVFQGWMSNGGADASLLPPLPAPRCTITDNYLKGTVHAGGLGLADYSCVSSTVSHLDAVVADNDFVLDTDNYGIGEFGTQGVCFLNNRMSGSAVEGMGLGDDYDGADGTTLYPVSGWKIIGNDFRDLTTSVASVYLGMGTTHCLVVGGPPPTTVLDEGIDNTLINVTPVDPPAAATPMNTLKQMKQLKGTVLP